WRLRSQCERRKIASWPTTSPFPRSVRRLIIYSSRALAQVQSGLRMAGKTTATFVERTPKMNQVQESGMDRLLSVH
ncbi:MAG: hypothetical protein AVDCRST_MAG93-2863, partial [uncultured Chloroflexia bacterium]